MNNKGRIVVFISMITAVMLVLITCNTGGDIECC